MRRHRVGVVFQASSLPPALSAVDNVVLPSEMPGQPFDPVVLAGLVAAPGPGRRPGHRAGV